MEIEARCEVVEVPELMLLLLRCDRANGKRCDVPALGALSEGKRVWKPANCGLGFDVGVFDGIPDQGVGLIDLDLMGEAMLDLSAWSWLSRIAMVRERLW